MKNFDTYEDASITIVYLYDNELDATNDIQELADTAIRCIESEMPDASIEAVAYITNEIIDLYEGIV